MMGDKLSFLNSSHHGFENLHVARAAAKIACQSIANIGVGGIRITSQQIDGGHHHAGRADAALRAATVDECPDRLVRPER